MGKTNGTSGEQTSPVPVEGGSPPEVLDLEVWLSEQALPPAVANVMRVLYRGRKGPREELEKLLQETLSRPAK